MGTEGWGWAEGADSDSSPTSEFKSFYLEINLKACSRENCHLFSVGPKPRLQRKPCLANSHHFSVFANFATQCKI